MDYSEYENAKQQREDLQKKLVSILRNQIDSSLPELQEMYKTHYGLISSIANSRTTSRQGLTLFKDSYFSDYMGHYGDGIVSLDLKDGSIQIYAKDLSVLNDPKWSYSNPNYIDPNVSVEDSDLAETIGNNDNFKLAMLATNPQAILATAINEEKDIIKKVQTLIGK